MKCRPCARPMDSNGDGTQSCRECGAKVFMRDAGYVPITDIPLRMALRPKEKAPVFKPDLSERICADSRSGPGCGEWFYPPNPTAMRCVDCSTMRRWPKAIRTVITNCEGDSWREALASFRAMAGAA